MLRRLLLCAVLLFLAMPAVAACDLSMVVSCQTGVNGAPSSCTATTTNNGSSACSGLVYSGWFSEESHERVQLSGLQTTLPLDTCVDSGDFGEFVDTAIAFCFGDTSIGAGQSFTSTRPDSNARRVTPCVRCGVNNSGNSVMTSNRTAAGRQ